MQVVALTALAAELGRPVEDLAEDLRDVVQIDAASGIRVVAAHTSRHLLAAHHERLQAEAQTAAARAQAEAEQQQRQAAQQAAETRARLAREAKQRELLRDDPTLSPIQVLRLLDTEADANTPAGRAFDLAIASERQGIIGHMYRFTPTKE